MTEFFNSQTYLYIVLFLIVLWMIISRKKLHDGILRVESLVSKVLPAPQAAAVDTVLNAVDTIATQQPQQSVADMFAVLERIVQAQVINGNVKVVEQAKAAGLFDDALKASVKSDGVASILQDLGQLKDALEAHVGALEPIVGKLIEKYVKDNKGA